MTDPASPRPAPAGPTGPSPWQTIWEQTKLHVSRAFAGAFQRIHATPAERALLAAPPRSFTDPAVQDYLSWRRSMAICAAI